MSALAVTSTRVVSPVGVTPAAVVLDAWSGSSTGCIAGPTARASATMVMPAMSWVRGKGGSRTRALSARPAARFGRSPRAWASAALRWAAMIRLTVAKRTGT